MFRSESDARCTMLTNVHVRRLSDITYLTLIHEQLARGPFQDSVGVLLLDHLLTSCDNCIAVKKIYISGISCWICLVSENDNYLRDPISVNNDTIF